MTYNFRKIPESDQKTKDRFWSKVVITANTDKCWEWTKSKRISGYGYFKLNKQMLSAHRVAYMLYFNDPTVNGLCCLHKCDNPSCVNPHHLFLGTQQENIKDMTEKGRHVFPKQENTARYKNPELYFGSGNPNSKLTAEQVLQIRREYSKEKRNGVKLARKYGIDKCYVYKIVQKESWNHL